MGTVRELWASRVLRAGAALAGVVFVVHAFGARNLAIGRSVTASSVCGATPAPEPDKPRLSRVVDGIVEERASYAMCTELEPHPWLLIDLGAPRSIESVVVHSRSDCCWGEHDIPLGVELSRDGVSFVPLATKNEPFTSDMPWKVAARGAKARFVRLRSPSEEPRHIVVSEVEVRGK